MVELVTFGETPLQFSPPGRERLETAREMGVHPDGTESSAAVAAAALGATATWISKLPDTPLGRRVVGELREHGIETEVVWADEGRQGVVYRESGHPPRKDAVWHDRADVAMETVNPGDLPMESIQTADAALVGASTATLSDQAASTVEAMLRAAHGSGVTTAVDLDYQPGFRTAGQYREAIAPLLDHLDVLIANEDNARAVLDRSGQPRELANTIAAENDLEMVVITRSEWGAVALHDTPGTNVIHERETIETEAVDTTGQHAAFSGGFLRQLAVDDDLAAALTHGVAAAALARSVPGPLLQVRDTELEDALAAVTDAS